MAEYLIQEETLTATADKFRDILGPSSGSFKDEIGVDGVFNTNAVTVYYTEYVDYTDGYDGVSPDVEETDVFIAYDFLSDNNGKLTPVIYKTNIEGDEPDTPDYTDQHFYVGPAEIDGILYDKWRKIEPGSDAFDWHTPGKKYLYTNVIINATYDKYSPTDFPAKIDEVYQAGVATIPDGYVKQPEGTLEITLNNIDAANPIDCSQYAKVTVNTAEPLRISDPTVLDNITDSPWGVGGNVFLYVGETTDTYENGALYYLEDTEK